MLRWATLLVGMAGVFGCGLDDRERATLRAVRSAAKATEVQSKAIYEHAERLMQEGRYALSADLVQRGRSSDPNNLDLIRLFWTATALEFLQMDSDRKALWKDMEVTIAEAMVYAQELVPILRLVKAIALVDQGNFDEAQGILETLKLTSKEELQDQKMRVHFELGKLKVRSNQIDEAIEHFHETLAEKDTFWHARLQLAQLLSKKADHKVAVEQGEKLVEQKQDGITYFVFGLVLANAGEQSRAVTAYERALQFPNVPASTMSELGQLYFSLKNFKKAREVFAVAYQKSRRIADKFNEGIAAKGMGEFGASAAIFEQVVRLNPQSPRAHVELLGALLQARRTKLAREVYERFVRLSTQYPALEASKQEMTAMMQPSKPTASPAPTSQLGEVPGERKEQVRLPAPVNPGRAIQQAPPTAPMPVGEPGSPIPPGAP
ncbi:MAG: tetratricopeptide repeat protein [Bradymonadia bacterium]